MAGFKKNNIQVSKVKAYPIDCYISKLEAVPEATPGKSSKTAAPAGTPGMQVKIIHLEELGIIFKVSGKFFRPTEEFSCSFEIPVFKYKIRQPITVVKTYESSESYASKGKIEKAMIVEAHFKNKMGDFHAQIRDFIYKIGQKKV